MMRPTVTALLAALAQFCSAEPALRGQDLDRQDPGPLPVVRGGDRPVAVPSASASPQEAPDGQRQVARGGRAPEAPDQSPRARELQQECGGMVPSSSYEFCGFCLDNNDKFFEGVLFWDVPDHEECLARCPISDKFVGYEFLPSEPSGLHCICRYEDGTVVRNYCPEGICRNADGTVAGNSCPNSYNDSNCRTSIGWIGEGPVTRGNGDLNVACRAKSACGDIQLPLQGGEYCGWCRDEKDNIFKGIVFTDVADSDACLAHCPVSDKFVGYEYALYVGGERNSCTCRYDAEWVEPINMPAGSFYYGGEGVGQVHHGNGELHAACRTRFADDAALEWLEAQTYTGAETIGMTDSQFDTWSQDLAAAILAGNFVHGIVANPGILIVFARYYRTHARNMAGTHAREEAPWQPDQPQTRHYSGAGFRRILL